MCCTAKRLSRCRRVFCFFFNDTAPTEIYTLSLHDALPILSTPRPGARAAGRAGDLHGRDARHGALRPPRAAQQGDRKSTRLNSSHMSISYAVFCLKKKNKTPVRRDTLSEHAHRLPTITHLS